jgi:hypothetical protein
MSPRTMAAGTLLGAMLLCGLGPGAAASHAPSVPAIVSRAASVYSANVRGIMGMQRHFSTVLHAGPVHHTEDSDSGQLMDDGSFLKIAYFDITDDRKALGKQQIAQRDTQTNQDWTVGKIFFKEPYDPHFTHDYTFDPPRPCSACPAGTVAVEFGSSVKDTQHGSGTMWIETATGRVARLTYIPNVLPPHSTFGSVTETSGWAIPGVWYVTRIDGTYSGTDFLVHGTGTFIGIFDHFRRFSSAAQGEAALQAGSI